ncbi:unnamed protein product [Polarella glacialis]|uniref:EngB-type G domain-containing protein n=1 Tax=Polarella glacialis TaxID=89957 RepID=A0A813M772_POLGL|nr:unnamed protein product [Polarella glacialis]
MENPILSQPPPGVGLKMRPHIPTSVPVVPTLRFNMLAAISPKAAADISASGSISFGSTVSASNLSALSCSWLWGAALVFGGAAARSSEPKRGRAGARGRQRNPFVSLQASNKSHAGLSLVKPEIRHSEIAQRSFFYSQCPQEETSKPEIAVFGRSNVGKSSMINFLCGRTLLSTISKHPGHTKLIHHFLIDKSWYLVDLPGIGFAEGSGRQLKQMDKIVSAYVRHRSTLVELLYLVDASLPPQDIDLEGIKWLVDSGVYLSVVLTKTDKRRRGENDPGGPAEVLANALWDMDGSPWKLGVIHELPRMFQTSTKLKTGREPLLEHIADIRRRCVLGKLQRKMPGKKSKDAREDDGNDSDGDRPRRQKKKVDGPPAIR